ncbi:hypothetical protein [Luteimicrobium album]|nr:hypothetical protein [Luteimicrobium album]
MTAQAATVGFGSAPIRRASARSPPARASRAAAFLAVTNSSSPSP